MDEGVHSEFAIYLLVLLYYERSFLTEHLQRRERKQAA